MTFSADGTGHCNINYNSRHVNLTAEDYGSSDESKKHVIRFLGIMPSLDNSSEEAIKDWKSTLGSIIDIYNCSPLGKHYGTILQMVDIFAKLTGMMSDHCAKEKKDATKLEELKLEAVFQKLGEKEVLEKSTADLVPAFLKAYENLVDKNGGKHKWETLSESNQREQMYKMNEVLIIELGQNAYEMLSDNEKRTLSLFIWAGCGCHKDLNTVHAGYIAMSKWWAEMKEKPPISLANKDTDAFLQKIDLDKELTPGQEKIIENIPRGAVKANYIAGSILNHKDDKKGYHDIFRSWWRKHKKTEFTFPDVSNNRFGTHCRASGEMLTEHTSLIQFLEYVKDGKQNKKFNHMEQNLWNALHDIPTLTEMAVLALYGQATSIPYMKKVRSEANMMTMGPFHQKVKDHIKRIIEDPGFLLGENESYEMGALDGYESDSPNVIQAVQSWSPQLPCLKPLLVRFYEGVTVGTDSRSMHT